MIYAVLIIYLLGALNTFITEMEIECGWKWSLIYAVIRPFYEAFGGVIRILIGVEMLILFITKKRNA